MIAPAVDIHDRDDALEISAELPGVSQDNIDLRIEGDMLTIRGEKRKERKDEQARLIERSYGSFQRTIQLPFAPNANEVRASFTDGVLTVTLPKTAEKEKSQRIEVRSGQSGGAGQRTIEGSLSSAQSSSAGRGQEDSGTGGGSGSASGHTHAGAGQSGPDDTGGSQGSRTSA
ncbi:Hsp20/alpha crystallin family protein [uncultured Paracoccus sp.]|uniref:Hsp20/alpha crystallin family protein n=1 Tax=uncultured Paracoccus sp. TaxID=189685 RepID=UPI002635064E|nr:Hsp20/alpha crystallin family protein [uncultured Paracoccus sp.]